MTTKIDQIAMQDKNARDKIANVCKLATGRYYYYICMRSNCGKLGGKLFTKISYFFA